MIYSELKRVKLLLALSTLDLALSFIDKIPMGTNFALLLLHEIPHEGKRYDLIDAFNSTSRYLDNLLNIDTIHFDHMVHRIYPAKLQLNKANASDTEAAFLDLNSSIHNDIVFYKSI